MPDDSVTREIFGNLGPAARGVFYLLAAAALASFAYGVYRRRRLWNLGRRANGRRLAWGPAAARLLQLMLQPLPSASARRGANLAHALLFGGFLVLFAGTLLIAVEHGVASVFGRAATEPVFHKGLYFAVYELVLDTCGILFLVGCLWFLGRWCLGRLGAGGSARGESSMERSGLEGVVLAALCLIGCSGYLVEGLRILCEQTPQPGYSYLGLAVARGLEAMGVHRPRAFAMHFALWWTHALASLAIIAAFPYTRLLHALVGAWNRVVAPPHELGTMTPLSLEDVERTGIVGVGALPDFQRRQLMQLDACVSCGRCEDVCPAHQAQQPLSPRDVVQDLRRQLNRPLLLAGQGGDGEACGGGRRLSEGAIQDETLWACTTCHACVDICPLGVSPLEYISDMRRNRVGEGALRGAPAAALQKMRRSGNPWGLPAQERLDWAAGLNVPRVGEVADFEVLYWVGCAAAYDRRIRKVARAVVRLLQLAQVQFAVLGPEERCTGESARRLGEEFLFQELAAANLACLSRYKIKKIVTHCPHCWNSLRQDYSQFGGRFEVAHHSQFLWQLVEDGRLPRAHSRETGQGVVTYHDPCYLARVGDVAAAPRELVQITLANDSFREMPRHGRATACCGAGGGRMWWDAAVDQRAGIGRIEEVIDSKAGTVAVACPFCLTMLQDGLAHRASDIQVKDIAEILADALLGDDSATDGTAPPA